MILQIVLDIVTYLEFSIGSDIVGILNKFGFQELDSKDSTSGRKDLSIVIRQTNLLIGLSKYYTEDPCQGRVEIQ
jgi:hypothetical protein